MKKINNFDIMGLINFILTFIGVIICTVIIFIRMNNYMNNLPVCYDNKPVTGTIISHSAELCENAYKIGYRYYVYIKIGDDTIKFDDPYIYQNYSDGQSCTIYYVTGYNKKDEIVSQEYCTSQKQID